MKCPKCNNMETKVIDSRVVEAWFWIRRRRSCEYCEHRFTTYEKVAVTDLIVSKRDGTKEMYDRDKLRRALVVSFWKKNLSLEKIDEIISQLENKRSGIGKEITSKKIGEDVLGTLRNENDVAYIRFASVFMEFETKKDFQAILDEAWMWT